MRLASILTVSIFTWLLDRLQLIMLDRAFQLIQLVRQDPLQLVLLFQSCLLLIKLLLVPPNLSQLFLLNVFVLFDTLLSLSVVLILVC